MSPAVLGCCVLMAAVLVWLVLTVRKDTRDRNRRDVEYESPEPAEQPSPLAVEPPAEPVEIADGVIVEPSAEYVEWSGRNG